MKGKWGSILWIVLLTTPSTASALDIERQMHGVVKITAAVDGTRRTGTGFIVKLEAEAAHILTASHVVEGDPNPKVEFYGRRGQLVASRIIHVEGGHDKGLALLLVEGKSNLPAGVVALRTSSSLAATRGEQVSAIGFPGGGDWQVINVNVAGREGTDITLSGGLSEGNSGGPVLKDNLVIGVVTTVRQLGYATPAAIVRLYLEANGIGVTEVDQTPQTAGEGLPVPTQGFRVVEVMLRSDPFDYKGKCPVKITFSGRISAVGGAGRVSYRFLRSDGASAPLETMEFDSPGSKDFEGYWSIGGPGMRYEGWQSVKVFEPREMESNKANFRIQCDAAPSPDVASVKILNALCTGLGSDLYRVEMRGEAAGPKGGYFAASAAPYRPGPNNKFSTTCGQWTLLPATHPRCQRKNDDPFRTAWSVTNILFSPGDRPRSARAFVYDDTAGSGTEFRPIVADNVQLSCQ